MRAAWIETEITALPGTRLETQVFAVTEALATCRASWRAHRTRDLFRTGKYLEFSPWRWKIAGIFGQELDPRSVKGKAVIAACDLALQSASGVFEPV